MTLGEKIRKLRRERDWTQAEFVERVGIDKRNVSRYENDQINPSRKTVRKFAGALGVSVEELLLDQPSKPVLVVEDAELLNLFREVSTLPERDRSAVKHVLSIIVKQNKIQQMIAS